MSQIGFVTDRPLLPCASARCRGRPTRHNYARVERHVRGIVYLIFACTACAQTRVWGALEAKHAPLLQ